MAVLLARPRSGRRGVVVLTHKEVKWLYGGASPRLRRRHRSHLQQRVDRLRDRYAFGVHAGWRLSPSSAALDERWEFVLATERLAPTLPGARRIARSSAHFIPDGYGLPAAERRTWDLVHVATQSAGKHWSRFLAASAALLAGDPSLRILGIATRVPGGPSLRDQASEVLGDNLGRSFILEEPDSLGFLKGWHPRIIERILAETKVLCLFSEIEGSSKVVSEASMAGCLVVLYEQLIDCCIEVPDDATHIRRMRRGAEAETLAAAIRSADGHRPDRASLAAFYGETASIAHLRTRLNEILGHPVDLEDTEGLRFRLPAHSDVGMPWVRRGPRTTTADAIDFDTMHRLLDHLEGLPQPGGQAGDSSVT